MYSTIVTIVLIISSVLQTNRTTYIIDLGYHQ